MRTAAVAALMVVAASPVYASDTPVYAPAPAWVKPAPDVDPAKLTDDAPMFVILDQQQRVQDGQVWTYFDSARRIISTQMLNEAGTLQLPWQPDSGDLIVHRAEILRGGERIDLLAAGQRFQILRREEQLEQLHINGVLTATLAVEGLRVGDVLRVSASMTYKDPALQGQVHAVMPLLPDPMRAQFGRARLSWPAGTDLHWKIYSDGIKPVPVTRGGFVEIELPLPLPKAPEVPQDAPLRYQPLPLLEAASFADWPSVSRTIAPLYRTEGLIAAGSPLAAEVAKIAAAESDPRKRAARALQLVQDEVRYLFNGMAGGNLVPQKPADTWSMRYGDCKAKTLLLLAMLRALGIEAEPVLANLSMGDLVAQRLPGVGAFDHVFVHATIAGESLWLDGTGGGQRLEDLADTPPVRTVLPVRETGAALMPVPMRPRTRPDLAIDVEYDQSAGLTVPTLYKITVRMRGQMAEMLRTMSSQLSAEQRDGFIRTLITPHVGEGVLAERAISYDAANAATVVTASGLVTTRWKFEEERYRTPLDSTVSELSFDPDRARPAWQSIPVSTGDATTMTYRTRVRLPRNGVGFTLDGDTSLPATLAGAQLSRTATLADGWATVEDRTAKTGAEIAPADIPAMRSAVALAQSRLLRLVAPADSPTHLQEVEAARRDPRRFDAIRAAYAKAIADDPDEAQPYTNRAAFLAGIYDQRGAIADLTKAIAIQPDAGTYRWRAQLWTQLGDTAKAIPDALAAYQLDPDETFGQLASLYSEAGRVDDALKLADERIAAGGTGRSGALALKSDVLARAGRTDEALAAIDAAIAASPGNPALLNSRCWLKGTLNVSLDTGLKDCTRAIELAESPAAALDSRAMVYFRMNRMEEALADLNAALDIARGMSASLYLRGVIRKRTGDTAAGDADLAAARMASPDIDKDYARWGIKP